MLRSGSRGVFGRWAGVCVMAVAVWASGTARAQCEELLPGTGIPGVFGTMERLIAWDPDGAGPEGEWLAAIGNVHLAETTPMQGVAVWDGTQWRDLINYVEGIGYDAIMYQGQLFIAGRFKDQWDQNFGLLRWNGSGFEPVPNAQADVRKLGVYNGELITYSIGAIQAWNGAQWRTLALTTGTTVRSLTPYNGELIVSGGFTSLAGVAANRVIAWNGTSWHALGSGLTGGSGEVMALAVHGGDLYATGYFTMSGGTTVNRIAKWNGSAWSAVGSATGLMPTGTTTSTRGEVLYSDGPDLYVGGAFAGADGLTSRNMARWDGSAWHATDGLTGGWVKAVTRYGDELAVTGSVQSAGGQPSIGLVFRNGDSWRTIASDGITATVESATVWDDKLVLSGNVWGAGDLLVNGITAWDGTTWETLGTGFGRWATHLTTYNGDLIAFGNLQTAGSQPVTGAARWDGAAWAPMGSITPSSIPPSSAVYNGELYVGGNLARWDGTAWVSLPGGVSAVRALAVYNGELIVGGSFTSAAGVPGTLQLAAFNGTSWRAIGAVTPSATLGPAEPGVYTLTVYNGELVATGHFESIGGSGSGNGYGVAAWDGTTWRGLAALPWHPADGTAARVYGDNLYVSADESPYLYRWDGTAWSVPVGGFEDGRVNALTEFRGALVAGGQFTVVGGEVSAFWARITDPCRCVADLTGDGLVDFGDYLEFLNLFDVQDPRVDFNLDGLVDFGDYLEFLNLFEAGC